MKKLIVVAVILSVVAVSFGLTAFQAAPEIKKSEVSTSEAKTGYAETNQAKW